MFHWKLRTHYIFYSDSISHLIKLKNSLGNSLVYNLEHIQQTKKIILMIALEKSTSFKLWGTFLGLDKMLIFP